MPEALASFATLFKDCLCTWSWSDCRSPSAFGGLRNSVAAFKMRPLISTDLVTACFAISFCISVRCAFSYRSRKLHMRSRPIISFTSAALIASAGFAQDKNQPTVDELVSKNVEAKGGAEARHALQSLRRSGKTVVQQGQIELTCVQARRRTDEVRTESALERRRQ